jgi:hypothetical protein
MNAAYRPAANAREWLIRLGCAVVESGVTAIRDRSAARRELPSPDRAIASTQSGVHSPKDAL